MYDERRASPIARLAVAIGAVSLLALGAAGPLHHLGLFGLAGALNPAAYGGPEIAAQQHQGDPDIAPLTLPVSPARAFDRALGAAQTLGWELAASDPAAGRIEATDTTFWFGTGACMRGACRGAW